MDTAVRKPPGESENSKNRQSSDRIDKKDFDEDSEHGKAEDPLDSKHGQIQRPGDRIKRILKNWIGKSVGVMIFLYVFIVALTLMGNGFSLLGLTAAGVASMNNSLLKSALVCLVIGILVTVLLQSSSATTSIVVCMVAANVIEVKAAIPMVMGANIGTSITNTIVAGGQARHRESFRYSFACATVHDCFNWFSVIVLLPLECATDYLSA
ncbi:sodium-dependent phosphate transport protein 2B-like [Ptychodera flava]|uniref:sodium-dependent phosphate transport protein 2B-like n=1 Tax=Ptychodera flava TaxID=63121 RepID=UPI003969C896